MPPYLKDPNKQPIETSIMGEANPILSLLRNAVPLRLLTPLDADPSESLFVDHWGRSNLKLYG